MSSSTAVKYQPLSQIAPSDDEDEGFHDNILYDSRLVSGPSMDHRNVFELEKLGQPRVRTPSNIQFLGRCRHMCLLAVVILVIILGVLVAILFPILNHMYNHGIVTNIHSGQESPDWTQLFNMTWTASNVMLVDADGDGLDDVLIGMITAARLEQDGYSNGNTVSIGCCLSQSNQYPISGQVTALRGYDGKKLWDSLTRSMVLYQNCMDIDVNGDGRMDCIVTGQDSTCQALDVQTGKTLWVIDPASASWASHLISDWAISEAVALPDLDSDGVIDLLVLHGQDQGRLAFDKPGRLVLLSGKTGLPIGHSYLEFPQGEGTFMSPMKYVTKDKAVYILFGSRETDGSGQLMAVSLPDIYCLATNQTLTGIDLSIYTWLPSTDKDGSGVVVLSRSQSAGAMMAPVLVDIDKDGYTDILVSSFDGSVELLDGKSLQTKWKKSFVSKQIHKRPTPGYFDTDSVLDFMVQLKTDRCDNSNNSQMLVLSGVDGEILWSFNAENDVLSSIFFMETLTDKLSVFMVTVVDVDMTCNRLQSELSLQMRAHQDVGDKPVQIFLSHLGNEELQNFCADVRQKVANGHVTCDHDLKTLTEKVLLLDQTTADQPLRIMERQAFKYIYKDQCEAGDVRCLNVSGPAGSKVDVCVVLVPTSSAGTVADVDADGSLDYIHVTQMTGLKGKDSGGAGPIGSVVVSKHNINSAISRGDFVNIKPPSDMADSQTRQHNQQHVQSWRFSQSTVQMWAQNIDSRRYGCWFVPT